MDLAGEYMNIQPVILGGDIGVYALGLEFFEAFGCQSICVANAPVDIITQSKFFDIELINSHCPDEELLAVLEGIAALHQDKKLVLLANTDSKVSFIVRYAEQLAKHYALPFPSESAIDLLCRKDSFATICEENGVKTPRTLVIDLKDALTSEWVPPTVEFGFPVVAKAASGAAYDKIEFPGKKKIWFVDDEESLSELWTMLIDAGYDDKFLVQELIPGDDTQMRSLTFYIDSNGTATLLAAARVLLEDPSPTMIGNPVAMITDQLPALWESAEKILKAGKYRGFANFDIKIDPRDGSAYFFEVNPRIGRNSYYVAAAGINPMLVMVRDQIGSERLEPQVAIGKVLYSLVPTRLITSHLKDEDLIAEVKDLVSSGLVFDPLESKYENSRRRRITVALQKMNYYRKFRKYYRHN